MKEMLREKLGKQEAEILERIIENVVEERIRQDNTWGKLNDYEPSQWLTILVEEVGEVAKEILTMPYDEPAEKYLQELTQVITVSVAAITDYMIYEGRKWQM